MIIEVENNHSTALNITDSDKNYQWILISVEWVLEEGVFAQAQSITPQTTYVL